MTESTPPPEGDEDVAAHTSDQLYTPEQLEDFAREQLATAHASDGDDGARQDQGGPVGGGAADPLRDPLPSGPPASARPASDGSASSLLSAGWPQADEDASSSGAGSGGTGGPMVPPPAAPVTPLPPSGPPSSPPSSPPPGSRPTGPPPGSRPTGPPPGAWPGGSPQQSTPPPPTTTSPPPAPAAPSGGPSGAPVPSEAPAAEPRRFMTATDFLDRRESEQELGPASWGWRGRVRRWSGGLIQPKMGAKEEAYESDRATVQRDFDGPRTIAFINPKGGAAKTTGVLAAGYTFGTVRGGGVVAWDNNETRGTLGIRGTRGAHRNTTRELLEDLNRFKDPTQSRIGDLGSFVRSQGDAHFDVLASDERPDVTGTIRAEDFNAVHRLLERFYRIILVDTGNNMRAENWLASADAADLLVITSTVREDTGYSGLWMLDALQDAGMQNLKYKAVTVLSDPSAQVDAKLAADLVNVYEQRTRAVYRVPYDPALVAGSVVPYTQLSQATRMSWLRACAGMASAL